MKHRIILTAILLIFSFPVYHAMASVTSPEEEGKQWKAGEVAREGAWCWFADPRALHHESEDGSINKTYIGYIDTHGAIKAMQYDFKAKRQEEVLIRSCFQPDDHDNPTFLVLPDERVMVFYSRHTDECRFYYRVSREPGDITTLGEEKIISTKDPTTYPSPFILSDDPTHIYLCWRGINWHPTIAKLSLPDCEDEVKVEWGPYQIVQSTGARPYAKYFSNGKDRIYLTYTTGHPDNEQPNFLYFNYIDIHNMELEDIGGRRLTRIADAPFNVDKTADYMARYPSTVVDAPMERDWVWQLVADKQGRPRIALVRISPDKSSHDYYYARWTGSGWKKTFLCNAGGHFHQTPHLEECYSAGMAIDPDCVNEVYCSVPVEGKHGSLYEIVKYTLDDEGSITQKEAITRDSGYNNVRPFMIPSSEGTPLRLAWMYGEYYDWIVSSSHPQGYCTGIRCDFTGFPPEDLSHLTQADENYSFHPKRDFTLTEDISPDSTGSQGDCLLDLGKLRYCLNKETMRPEVRYGKRVYPSTNVLGTSDCWKEMPRATNGKWYKPQELKGFQLKLVYKRGILSVYINGALDQKVTLR